MKLLIFTILLSFPLIADSPFHTDIVITSEYLSTTGKGGERRNNVHKGLDCHAVNFYPVIYPVMNGTVTRVDWDDIYGKYVVIKTVLETDFILSAGEIIPAGTQLFHKYAHGKLIYYSAAGEVDVNTPIMIMGETGYADGPHLHLEVWSEKKYYNPEEFVK